MDVVLVHGYNVTSTKTYGVLPHRLKSMGHTVKDVYLSKYVTLDDDLTLADIVKAFNAALTDTLGAGFERRRFACITHSTGGVVVRGWITARNFSASERSPISHLIMLAPPTNGSRLAAVGKSRLSRLRTLVGLEPGLKVLDALELGSDYQWDLNLAWMHRSTGPSIGVFPFVITGQWIDKKIWDVIVPATYERGSDGVVRVAAANLNTQFLSIGSSGDVRRREVMEGVPFLVTPKTAHSDSAYGVMGSIPKKGDHPVIDAIQKALRVRDRAAYKSLAVEFARQTTDLQQKDTYYDGTPLDRYCQVVFQIRDDMGNALSDYAIELVDGENRGDRLPKGFFAHSHKNGVSPERYVYYLNFDRLLTAAGGRLGFRMSCATGSPLVIYPDVRFQGPACEIGTFVKPNQTTLVEVTMNRRLNKNVFRLTKNFGYQKIKPVPGPDWIE